MKQKKIENKNHKIDNNDKRERNMEIMKCQKREKIQQNLGWRVDFAAILLVKFVKCICPNCQMYLSKL